MALMIGIASRVEKNFTYIVSPHPNVVTRFSATPMHYVMPCAYKEFLGLKWDHPVNWRPGMFQAAPNL